MRRRLFLTSLPLAFVAEAARAAETKPATGQNVDLAPVAMPIIVNGRLINYVFVYIRIDLTPSADAIHLRDKEPFFRDALVRDAYRTPFLAANDFNRIDEGKLKAALFRDASAIAGAANVRGVAVVSQTPQHFVPQPPHTIPQ